MSGQALVVRGNALNLPMPDASVDLIVTSPPYFALRSYQDEGEHYEGQIGSEPTPKEFLEALWAATREMVRVLKPTGSCWINLGDKYAGSGGHNNSNISRWHTAPLEGGTRTLAENDAQVNEQIATRRNAPDRYNQDAGGIRTKSLMGLPWRYAIGCIDDLGLILRAEVIWSKVNSLPESVQDRVRRSHEQWFHFTKEPRYFAAVDEVREPHAVATLERDIYKRGRSQNGGGSPESMEGHDYNRRDDLGDMSSNPLGKLPGSVWTIPSEPLIVPEWARTKYNLPDHFAAFPQEWPRRIILGWSPPNGVIVDPFGGTGTVAMVARTLGRTGISVDLSMDYSRLAKWRIFESGHASKAMTKTNLERQGSLL